MKLFGIAEALAKKSIFITPKLTMAEEADAISLSLRKGGEGPERLVDKQNMQLPSADPQKVIKPEQLDQEITPG